MVMIDNHKTRNIQRYFKPDDIIYREKGSIPGINYSYISIRLTPDEGDGLMVGDKIAFCGNKIIYRKEALWLDKYNYVYIVFQISSNSKENNKRKKYNI